MMIDTKKPLPILSYPALQFVGASITEAVTDSDVQMKIMKTAADRCSSAAAVSVMDLSVEAECFGSKITFFGSAVPVVSDILVTDAADADRLAVPKPGSGRTGIFAEAITKSKKLITDRPVLAGAAAPFSLAARLTGVTECMLLCFDEPEMMKTVLEKTTEFVVNYVRLLKASGADGVILAEPVAGLLSPSLEEEFSAPYTKQLADAVRSDGFTVIYHNCGQAVARMTDSVFANGCDAYHFGNVTDVKRMLELAPSDKLVMGNIDPVGLFRDGTPEMMKTEVKKLLSECGVYDNFVLSSGCDIPQNAKWDNINAFFETASEFYGV